MATQNYKNHKRYYFAHHFVFYPLLMLSIAAAINGFRSQWNSSALWIALVVVLFFLGWLSFMLRQHYALGNQNRIVRLEFRLRYYMLTKQNYNAVESKLTFGQIAALRFASEEEFLILLQRALDENLSPDDIKRSITTWIADDMRV